MRLLLVLCVSLWTAVAVALPVPPESACCAGETENGDEHECCDASECDRCDCCPLVQRLAAAEQTHVTLELEAAHRRIEGTYPRPAAPPPAEVFHVPKRSA